MADQPTQLDRLRSAWQLLQDVANKRLPATGSAVITAWAKLRDVRLPRPPKAL